MKVRRIKDAFETPFRNKLTSSVAESQAPVNLESSQDETSAILDERLKEKERSTEGMSTLSRSYPSSLSKDAAPHRFGSAADMPPPPVPNSQPLVSTGVIHSVSSTGTNRYESPPWDIELDLDDVELQEQMAVNVNPVSTKTRVELGSETVDVLARNESMEKEKVPKRPVAMSRRSLTPPTPERTWDIELDLNDD